MENTEFTKVPFKLNGGINLDLVEKETMNLTDNFICSICLGLVLDPILCKENECIFCRECIEGWLLKHQECPNCKSIFVKNTGISRLLKNILFKIKIKCVFLSSGCSNIIDYQNYPTHLETCEFNSFKCNNSGCPYVGIRKDILIHSKVCNLKKIQCKICKESFLKDEIKKHQEVCKYVCPICKSSVEPSNIGTHNNGDCYETLVNVYLKYSKGGEDYPLNINNLQSNLNNLSINKNLVQKTDPINPQLNIHKTNIKTYNPSFSNSSNQIFKTVQQSDPKWPKCHNILNLSTCAILNPETNKTSCSICRAYLFCRFQCNTCKLNICYKCYYSKSKNYCPRLESHVLKVFTNHNLNYCDKCQQSKMTKVYKDTTCNIQICEGCAKEY